MPSIPQRTLRGSIAALFVPLALATAALPHAAIASPAPHAAHAVHAGAVKPNAAFDKWADSFAQDWVRLNPQMATMTQYFSGAEQDALDRQLTPLTDAQRKKELALARAGLKKLDAFLAGPLSQDQRISAATIRWQLANDIAGEPFKDHRFVFSQFSGAQVGLVNFMTQAHPLRRASDVDSYLARLEQVATRLDEAIARGRGAAKRSLIPPRFILERAQAQVETFLKPEAAQNVLVTSLAQRTAVEQGWYEGDVPGLLGALGSELFRARRLVVDTGIHAKGWTREQGIDYGIGAQEVERYVAWPGQATAYMTGMLRILDMREKARAALGDRFSLPGFHDVVLRSGSVPLEVLQQLVDEWVAAELKK